MNSLLLDHHLSELCIVRQLAAPEPPEAGTAAAKKLMSDATMALDRLGQMMKAMQTLSQRATVDFEQTRALLSQPQPQPKPDPSKSAQSKSTRGPIDDDAIEVRKEMLCRLLMDLEKKQAKCESLHAENEALAKEIAAQKVKLAEASDTTAPSLESMTWEQRKALILKQLENEDGMAGGLEQRQTLIDVVAETDRVIEDRDREIAELRELLRQQPRDLADDHIAGAAGIAAMLDGDEFIQTQREEVFQLKQQWEDKLRAAEVEISLQRAALSRRERELADQLRRLDV